MSEVPIIRWKSVAELLGWKVEQADEKALDHVEECLDMLHTSICGIVPQEAATGPAGMVSQMMIAENVKEDYKKLRKAILALRKQKA